MLGGEICVSLSSSTLFLFSLSSTMEFSSIKCKLFPLCLSFLFSHVINFSSLKCKLLRSLSLYISPSLNHSNEKKLFSSTSVSSLIYLKHLPLVLSSPLLLHSGNPHHITSFSSTSPFPFFFSFSSPSPPPLVLLHVLLLHDGNFQSRIIATFHYCVFFCLSLPLLQKNFIFVPR